MPEADRLLREALALHHAGRLREAQLLYSRVLSENPDNAEALHLSGLVAFRESRFDDAIELLRRAVERAPGNALYLGNLGNVLRDSGHRDQAIESYERALAIDPDHVSLRNSLGAIRMEAGTTEAAIDDFRAVIARKPDHFKAHLNLGDAFLRTNNADAAERAFRRALALNPDSAEALGSLAALLKKQDRAQEAVGLLKRRSIVDPESVEAHAELARALEGSGAYEAALASYQQALAIAPDDLGVRCDFCLMLQKTCDWERLALHSRDLPQAISQQHAGIPPRLLLSLHEITPALQLEAMRANASGFTRRTSVCSNRIDPAASRLRIGYLSLHRSDDDVGDSIADVLQRHDRARFEVFAFCYGSASPQSMGSRLRDSVDYFFDVDAIDDERAARRIADSAIDILVDIGGNADLDRIGIAAFRPAPVQAAWLGIPGTRGAPFYDYLIADRYVAPTGVEALFAEEIVRLPHCYLSPGHGRSRSQRIAARAQHSLPDNAVVLCCFNESSLISAPMFALWLRVLAVVPDAVLWLEEDNAVASLSLRRRAGEQGIAPERLVFAPKAARSESLARYQLADLAIDTFANFSSSSAADALWMGCPLVTLTGDTFASRSSTSLVANAGLPELAAVSPARYEELIIDLARDAVRREALRDRLLHATSALPLFDSARLAQDLERAYVQMAANAAAGTACGFDLR